MSSAADLGISEQEFQDAVNLEKMYSLTARIGGCQRCGNRPLTHADLSTYQLLCSTCGSIRSNTKRIGETRFRRHEVEQFEKRIGGGKLSARSPKGRGRSSPAHAARKRSSNRRRSPSVSSSSSTASVSSSSSSDPPKKSKKKKGRSRSQPSKSPAAAFDDFFDAPSAFGGSQGMAGMRGMMTPFGQQPMAGVRSPLWQNPQKAMGWGGQQMPMMMPGMRPPAASMPFSPPRPGVPYWGAGATGREPGMGGAMNMAAISPKPLQSAYPTMSGMAGFPRGPRGGNPFMAAGRDDFGSMAFGGGFAGATGMNPFSRPTSAPQMAAAMAARPPNFPQMPQAAAGTYGGSGMGGFAGNQQGFPTGGQPGFPGGFQAFGSFPQSAPPAQGAMASAGFGMPPSQPPMGGMQQQFPGVSSFPNALKSPNWWD